VEGDPVGARIPTPEALGADRVVLDAPHPTLRGGTGTGFGWDRVATLEGRQRYLVAGGIRADNVARAERLGLHAVDLCSGVESAPGRKDHPRIAALFDALRAAPATEPA